MQSLSILYEDNHLLVVNKPAGIATMGSESGPTVHSMAADYLKRTYHKPGKAFVGIVSRLDSMTSGVLVLARTSKAASRLSEQFAGKSQAVTKIYLAVVAPPPAESSGELTDWLCKDDRAKRMRTVGKTVPEAKQARLRFFSLDKQADHALVAIQLLTGRKHQVRVQFADRGHPIIGDRKYGSPLQFSGGIALHSWRLQIVHPTRRVPLWFAAEPPVSWNGSHRRIVNSQQAWQATKTAFALSDDDSA